MSHELGRPTFVVHHVSSARNIFVDGTSDVTDVGHLGKIVSVHASETSGPDEDVVGQVSGDSPGLLFRRHQGLTEQGDVFVIPSVSVGNCSTVGDTIDLVPVIPPGHHTSVLRGMITQPPVGLHEIIDDNGLSLVVATLDENLRVRHLVGHHVTVIVEVVSTHTEADEAQDGDEREESTESLRNFELRSSVALLGDNLRFSRSASVSGDLGPRPLNYEPDDHTGDHGSGRREDQEETNHLVREIVGKETEEDTKDLGVAHFVEEEEESQGSDVVDVVEVLPVVGRRSGLMFGYGVDQGVSGTSVGDEKRTNTVREGSQPAGEE